MDKIRVIFERLPLSIKGMVVRTFDEEDYYTIVINSNISAEQQKETYKHELMHIAGRDFENGMSVEEIEHMRHIWQ